MSSSVISLRDLDRLRQDGARVKPKSKSDLVREAVLEYLRANPLPTAGQIAQDVRAGLPTPADIARLVPAPPSAREVAALLPAPDIMAAVNTWMILNSDKLRGEAGVGIESITVEQGVIIIRLSDKKVLKFKLPRTGGGSATVVQNNIGTDGTARIVTVTADYTVPTTIDFVFADATAGAITITLPDATKFAGRRIEIKKINTNTNAVSVIATVGGVEGSTGFSIVGRGKLRASYEFISNGTDWYIT